jgi:Na+-driven multidrug efflux pump
MPESTSESRPNEITIIVVLIALLILLPPILVLWAFEGSYWLMPYLVWSAIILLSYFLQRHLKKHAV